MPRPWALLLLCAALAIGGNAESGKPACAFYGMQPPSGQALLKSRGWRCSKDKAGAWTGTNPCKWGKASGLACDGGTTLSSIDLDCKNGMLGGPLGDSLIAYTSLRTFKIANCILAGGIPPAFSRKGVLNSVEVVSLRGNRLTGFLPSWLGQQGSLRSLKELDLSYNLFEGGLPGRWAFKGFFSNLERLNLRSNPRLSGAVPYGWAQTGTGWPASLAINIAATSIRGPLSPLTNSGNFKIFANVGPGAMCGKLPASMADPGTDGGVYPAWLWPSAPLRRKYTKLPAC